MNPLSENRNLEGFNLIVFFKQLLKNDDQSRERMENWSIPVQKYHVLILEYEYNGHEYESTAPEYEYNFYEY